MQVFKPAEGVVPGVALESPHAERRCHADAVATVRAQHGNLVINMIII